MYKRKHNRNNIRSSKNIGATIMSDILKESEALRKVINERRSMADVLKKDCTRLEARKKDLEKDCQNRSLESATLTESIQGLRKKKSEFDAYANKVRIELGDSHTALVEKERTVTKEERSNQREAATLLEEKARLGKYKSELDLQDLANKTIAKNLAVMENQLKSKIDEATIKTNKIDSRVVEHDKAVKKFEEQSVKFHIDISKEYEEAKALKDKAKADSIEAREFKRRVEIIEANTVELAKQAADAMTGLEQRMAEVKRIEGDLARRTHDISIKEQEVETDRLRVVKLARDRGVTKDLEKLQKELAK